MNLDDYFGAGSPLADCLDGFSPRAEQLAMAQVVSEAIATGTDLAIEAGTGTGKTLAYLIPVLLSGKRVIVSTRTKTLQDQLYHRDLPTIAQALGRPAVIAQLKGRANYLCRYRLTKLSEKQDFKRSSSDRVTLGHLERWAAHTRTGDINEVAEVAEDSPLWPQVTSTADNCLGSKCPAYVDCHVVSARQAARDAEIVIVNHHLLVADLTMKEEGFSQLLPGSDVVIVDEAHQFPDVAQGAFNISLSSGRMAELIQDLRRETVNTGLYDGVIDKLLDAVDAACKDASIALPRREGNLSWADAGTEFAFAFDLLADQLIVLRDWLSAHQEASPDIRKCLDRARSLLEANEQISVASDLTGLRWVRTARGAFTANLTPLEVSTEIASLLMGQGCTWVFTSATLAVGGDFSHFLGRVGMPDTSVREIPSPFDYPGIARLYLPQGLPPPNTDDYTDQAVASMVPVLQVTRGRAFLLFTSHRALRRAAELLQSDDRISYPLLIQGSAPRSRLIDDFAASDNAVLLGTATFWEGIDIRGDGLVLVAIDRLPFASPGDPLLAARLEAIRSSGGNPFRSYQLPQAVLSLKQGAGRLIRDYQDHGVVMICDPRLSTSNYGKVFIDSLPTMPVIRSLDEVRAFFEARKGDAE